MDDIVSLIIEQVVALLQQHDLLGVGIVCSVGLLAIYGGYHLFASALGIEQKRADILSKRAAALGKLHEAEERHVGCGDMLNLHLALLTQEICDLLERADEEASSNTDLLSKREEAIAFYCNDYLPTLSKYLDFYELYHRKRRTRRRFVRDVLQLELDTAHMFVDTVNAPGIVAALQMSELPFTRRTFSKLWAFWRDSLWMWNLALWLRYFSERRKWSP